MYGVRIIFCQLKITEFPGVTASKPHLELSAIYYMCIIICRYTNIKS